MDDISRLQKFANENTQTGTPLDANASMIMRRLKVYNFTERLPKSAVHLPYCARCFASLVLQQSSV